MHPLTNLSGSVPPMPQPLPAQAGHANNTHVGQAREDEGELVGKRMQHYSHPGGPYSTLPQSPSCPARPRTYQSGSAHTPTARSRQTGSRHPGRTRARHLTPPDDRTPARGVDGAGQRDELTDPQETGFSPTHLMTDKSMSPIHTTYRCRPPSSKS
eukprot:1158696-Pelagomonas_calceolata.AAC.10